MEISNENLILWLLESNLLSVLEILGISKKLGMLEEDV